MVNWASLCRRNIQGHFQDGAKVSLKSEARFSGQKGPLTGWSINIRCMVHKAIYDACYQRITWSLCVVSWVVML